MNARKLPSGNYRARAFDYTDYQGKKHYKSFTAPTKAEAERLASAYACEHERLARSDLKVSEAISGYITSKAELLSPSTLRMYKQTASRYFDAIANIKIRSITVEQLQRFISSLSHGLSPKTVANVYGLLSGALSMYLPDRIFRVTLPKRAKKQANSPSDEDVAALFNSASGWLKLSIGLAAFCSMRRGEISAVTFGDLDGNRLHVHRDMVKGENGWILKDIPKTSDSDRWVLLPEPLRKLVGKGDPDAFIVPHYPGKITNKFVTLRNKLGLSIRFHDLRHYYASTGVVLGVPDVYMAGLGGWRPGSGVLKETYQNKIIPISDRYAAMMADHFKKICEK